MWLLLTTDAPASSGSGLTQLLVLLRLLRESIAGQAALVVTCRSSSVTVSLRCTEWAAHRAPGLDVPEQVSQLHLLLATLQDPAAVFGSFRSSRA